jgi:hypothetical protein
MKPRHATALALVGWYLMVPPFQGLPSPFVSRAYIDAPLNEWQMTEGSWNSVEACNQKAKRNYAFYLEAKQKQNRAEGDRMAK